MVVKSRETWSGFVEIIDQKMEVGVMLSPFGVVALHPSMRRTFHGKQVKAFQRCLKKAEEILKLRGL